jgi:uncharacterized membrane protein
VVAATYLVLFGALSILRHETYHSSGFDLGLFDQVMWNTVHWRPFESTMSQALPVPHSLLGDHFSVALLVLAPFYFAYPHPETLLVAQTVVLTCGAWPVYLLARLKLPAGYALAWVVAYLLFLPLSYVNLDGFHEVALAVAPLGFALYFLERRNIVVFLACLLFTFLIKEEMTLIGVGFGAYVLLGKRDWRIGPAVIAGSLLTFGALIGQVVPHFAGGRSYPYIAERYGQVGGSPLGVLCTFVTDPLRIASSVAQPKKIFFLFGIFGPVVALSAFAGWASLVLLPTLGYLLLSSYEPQFSFTSQYSAPLIPLVIATAILAMARIPRKAQFGLAAAVLASTITFSWAFGYMPYSRKFNPDEFTLNPRYTTFVPKLAMIGPDDSVSAETGLSSHLSERRYIYDYQFEGVQDAQWVVLDYEESAFSMSRFQAQLAAVEAMGYVEVAEGHGLALLRRS